MRRFLCPNCGNEVHFNSGQCVNCATLLGYAPSTDQLVALPNSATTPFLAPCRNRNQIGCNWLCEPGIADGLCMSCVHTTKIPDISIAKNRDLWGRLEIAKRRLFYELLKFGLPLESRLSESENFLHFELLGDEIGGDGKTERVITGHHNGRITINIAEADDAIREKNRTSMGEPYRTLLGHFRHEVGHFYWDQLIARSSAIDGFRACFGDERFDYAEALATHYRNGPPMDWQNAYVSAYSSAHPWEDFAESWAHYFHMVSGLETAYAYGINPQPLRPGAPRLVQFADPYQVSNIEQLVDHWVPLTVAMNAMNRSIGNHDYYPFVLSETILRKLKFIHELIAQA